MEEEVTRCMSRLEELLRGNVGCPALLPETDDLLLSVFVCSRLVQQWTGFMAGVCQACMKVPASVLGGGGGGVSAILFQHTLMAVFNLSGDYCLIGDVEINNCYNWHLIYY